MKSGGRRKYLLRGYEYRSRIIYEGEGGWERCIVDERIYIYKYYGDEVSDEIIGIMNIDSMNIL